MLIINVQQGESIDKALKKYKQKLKKTKQLQNLKDRKFFTKKSVARREEIAKARHKETFERSIQDF